MLIIKAAKYRLDLTSDQESLSYQIAGNCRAVKNLALEQRKLAWTMNKDYISYEDQANQLKDLKSFAQYFKTTPAQCLQQALKDVDTAYDRFTRKISITPNIISTVKTSHTVTHNPNN